MKIRIAAIVLTLSSALTLSAQQQQPAQPRSENRRPLPQAVLSPDRVASTSAAEANDLAANLARMRALVQRMQSNLPAVASGQSPLEHEFQLDIEMWQLLIDQMEKQVKATSQPAP